ncbi:MAG: hypothetical protein WBG50_03355 [Desulfomonilaceae bacterium]
MGKKARRKKIAMEIDYNHFILVASAISLAKTIDERIGIDNYDCCDWDSEVSEIARIASEACAQARAACHEADFNSPDMQATLLVSISQHCLYLAQETVAFFLDDDGDCGTTGKITIH